MFGRNFFGKQKSDSSPLGVRLGDLLQMLAPTTIKANIVGNTLIAQHEHYRVTVEVVPPEVRETEDGPIRAVVRIKSGFPKPILEQFGGKYKGLPAALNSFAALGGVTCEGKEIYVGSRLTIYESEDAWITLHLPLLLSTIISGSEPILGGLKQAFGSHPERGGNSDWTASDFEFAHSMLSRVCLCTTGGLGLTAEFGLSEGSMSAAKGDKDTALFQMVANQPHPELGGGLFCILQMPHEIADKVRLEAVCAKLNQLEMRAIGLPPHFGAWCEGKRGNNLAYVSFIPNAMYPVSGIALNAAVWAMNRSEFANKMLLSMGIRV